jgi:hypothetical protein
MRYSETRTQEILRELELNEGLLESYDDILHGKDYLQAVADGRIGPRDPLLMMSLDGAQLYRNKASDCWMSIWIVFNLPPGSRYLKAHVLSGTFIPGPNKPKNLDSFIYPSLHHLSAIQKEGLPIWDVPSKSSHSTNPFLFLATADGPGMSQLNGLVGHHGKVGCRLYCPLKGRHKPGGPHYYPALLKPYNYSAEGCDHNDVDLSTIYGDNGAEKYYENLRYVMSSTTETQFKKRRLETGICKPSLFLGLLARRRLSIPGCFPGKVLVSIISVSINAHGVLG